MDSTGPGATGSGATGSGAGGSTTRFGVVAGVDPADTEDGECWAQLRCQGDVVRETVVADPPNVGTTATGPCALPGASCWAAGSASASAGSGSGFSTPARSTPAGATAAGSAEGDCSTEGAAVGGGGGHGAVGAVGAPTAYVCSVTGG